LNRAATVGKSEGEDAPDLIIRVCSASVWTIERVPLPINKRLFHLEAIKMLETC
jgi:hypothetical protein